MTEDKTTPKCHERILLTDLHLQRDYQELAERFYFRENNTKADSEGKVDILKYVSRFAATNAGCILMRSSQLFKRKDSAETAEGSHRSHFNVVSNKRNSMLATV
jgi:hypothetical protein